MAKQGFGGQWIEICRVGTAVDSTGKKRDLDRNYLEKVVANYNAGNHEAPIVIGHPKEETAPAYGWTEELRLNGDVVEARFKETDDVFEQLVGDGRYKKRSGSFYLDPPNLRHIGFLGAQPPAIKGLRDIQFADGESFTFETQFNLQETKMLEDKDVEKVTEGVFEKIKNFFKSPEGKTADLSEERLGEIVTSAVQTATAKVKEDLTTEFKEKLDAKDKVIEALASKVDGQIAGGVRAEILSFVEAIPADKGKHFLKRIHIAEFLESLAIADAADEKAAEAISFSEGDGDDKTDHKFSRLGYAKELISSIAPMVEFGEKFGDIVATAAADETISPQRREELKGKMGVKKDGGEK